MQVPTPKISVSVHLGQDNGQSLLTRVSATNYSGVAEVNGVKQKAKLAEQVGSNLLFLIKYLVYPGRENEALKYLQDGFNQEIDRQFMSPLQFITRKHDDEQVQSTIYSEAGAVVVRYKFPIDEDLMSFLSNLAKFNNVRVEVVLKGFVSHTLKNRTNVKVDYSLVNVSADEFDIESLHSMLVEGELFPPELISNPFYSVLQKARKIHLSLRFKSFRQMNKYYEEVSEIMGNSYKKHEKEDFKYMAPGLFKEKVEAYAFLQDSFAVTADITHQGEDIFLRLIKVYFKAAKKGLDL